MLIDHIDLRVSDFAKVRPLYDALLPAMGYSEAGEDDDTISYYRPGGRRTAPFFGITADPAHRANGCRIALYASSRAEVDRLASVAQSAGATAFEPAALIEEYSPHYYASFFEDADGNKLEICFREPPSFDSGA
jgi:catechol 2,3-dioxygenase-like lactoylglutathione lyase family enzyme